ncbi:hypothetical protein DFH07DRAFT_771705 [Mycena maculata]|uniref:Uncharacterized protein n=1 Tax=Mycena maculata TaxID=230809 RepID=A0AAD7JAB8_9AGAR|nr:hypothetical protein DFH07DRAFT_771705 [Mycena maculata]
MTANDGTKKWMRLTKIYHRLPLVLTSANRSYPYLLACYSSSVGLRKSTMHVMFKDLIGKLGIGTKKLDAWWVLQFKKEGQNAVTLMMMVTGYLRCQPMRTNVHCDNNCSPLLTGANQLSVMLAERKKIYNDFCLDRPVIHKFNTNQLLRSDLNSLKAHGDRTFGIVEFGGSARLCDVRETKSTTPDILTGLILMVACGAQMGTPIARPTSSVATSDDHEGKIRRMVSSLDQAVVPGDNQAYRSLDSVASQLGGGLLPSLKPKLSTHLIEGFLSIISINLCRWFDGSGPENLSTFLQPLRSCTAAGDNND